MTRQDQFAEYLSQGWTIPQIREAMDLTNGAAQGLMTRICRKLGEQAR